MIYFFVNPSLLQERAKSSYYELIITFISYVGFSEKLNTAFLPFATISVWKIFNICQMVFFPVLVKTFAFLY